MLAAVACGANPHCVACHANAAETPLRVHIAESDSVHHVGMQSGMQTLFAYSGAFDSQRKTTKLCMIVQLDCRVTRVGSTCATLWSGVVTLCAGGSTSQRDRLVCSSQRRRSSASSTSVARISLGRFLPCGKQLSSEATAHGHDPLSRSGTA